MWSVASRYVQLDATIRDRASAVEDVERADLVEKYLAYADFCDNKVAELPEGWPRRVYAFKAMLVRQAAWRLGS
jgi:hypothetical protein